MDNETVKKLTDLSNLYLQVFVSFEYLSEILEKDSVLQDIAARLKWKSDVARENLEILIQFLYDSGEIFHLKEMIKLTDFDLGTAIKLEEEVKALLDSLKSLAKDKGIVLRNLSESSSSSSDECSCEGPCLHISEEVYSYVSVCRKRLRAGCLDESSIERPDQTSYHQRLESLPEEVEFLEGETDDAKEIEIERSQSQAGYWSEDSHEITKSRETNYRQDEMELESEAESGKNNVQNIEDKDQVLSPSETHDEKIGEGNEFSMPDSIDMKSDVTHSSSEEPEISKEEAKPLLSGIVNEMKTMFERRAGLRDENENNIEIDQDIWVSETSSGADENGISRNEEIDHDVWVSETSSGAEETSNTDIAPFKILSFAPSFSVFETTESEATTRISEQNNFDSDKLNENKLPEGSEVESRNAKEEPSFPASEIEKNTRDGISPNLSTQTLVGSLESSVREVKDAQSRMNDIFPFDASKFELPSELPLIWRTKVSRILVVKKLMDITADRAFDEVIHIIHNEHPNLEVFVERRNDVEYGKSLPSCLSNCFVLEEQEDVSQRKIDLVIMIGGDGTLLHAASLFKNDVPPILGFRTGSINYLVPFPFERQNFSNIFSNTLLGKMAVNLRMRLKLSLESANGLIEESILNEVAITRGSHPGLCKLDLLVNDEEIERIEGDGILIATPTGSTAYSSSAGGAFVHPTVPCLQIVPIASVRQKSRPIIVPTSRVISIRMAHEASNSAMVAIDGKKVFELQPGKELRVVASEFLLPVITSKESIKDEVPQMKSFQSMSMTTKNDEEKTQLPEK